MATERIMMKAETEKGKTVMWWSNNTVVNSLQETIPIDGVS